MHAASHLLHRCVLPAGPDEFPASQPHIALGVRGCQCLISDKSVPWTCRDSGCVTYVHCLQMSPVIILSVRIPDSICYPWISPLQAQGQSLAERQSLMPLEGL